MYANSTVMLVTLSVHADGAVSSQLVGSVVQVDTFSKATGEEKENIKEDRFILTSKLSKQKRQALEFTSYIASPMATLPALYGLTTNVKHRQVGRVHLRWVGL